MAAALGLAVPRVARKEMPKLPRPGRCSAASFGTGRAPRPDGSAALITASNQDPQTSLVSGPSLGLASRRRASQRVVDFSLSVRAPSPASRDPSLPTPAPSTGEGPTPPL